MLKQDKRVRPLRVSPSKNRVIAMIYRQLILFRRHFDRKLEVMFWPVIDAILFGAIASYASEHGSPGSAAVLLSGFVMAQVVWHSHIHFAKFFLQEGWDWNVLFMLTRPLTGREVLTAAVSLAIGVAVCAVLFISTVITLVFHLHLLEIPMSIAILIPILMVLGWTTAMLATGVVLRMGQKADNLVWAIFGVIGPLSGAIVPVENLPGFLKYLALLIPTTHAYEAGRAILFGSGFPVAELTIAAVSAALSFAGALWFLSRSFTKFRVAGYISRYM
jgi:ABC-2 type transport system permease protein